MRFKIKMCTLALVLKLSILTTLSPYSWRRLSGFTCWLTPPFTWPVPSGLLHAPPPLSS